MKRVIFVTIVFLLVSISSASEKPRFVIESPDGQPFIQVKDIVSYQWSSHIITLKPGLRDTLEKAFGTHATPFLVRVNGETIYRGHFVSALSSASYGSIVIVLNPMVDQHLSKDQLQISLGYPTEKFFTEKDFRSDTRVHSALAKAQVIKDGT